jgi:hypothetical protein
MRPVSLFIERWAAWAPGLENAEALAAWARGETSIRQSPDAPALEFLPALFRRRLSQLSRMALEVGHRLSGDGPKPPCVFASCYGEINKQYAITQGLLDSMEVSPAIFSLSVFNAPAYLLSLAEHNTAPATAVYAGEQTLSAAFLEAAGFLRQSAEPSACLVLFADEFPPPAYARLFSTPVEPYAFGLALSSRPAAGARQVTVTLTSADDNAPPAHPLDLLRWLAARTAAPFRGSAAGVTLAFEAAAS